ncbi:MAG: DUF488 domain-containing protein [Pseudomonadota bacterium]
MQQQDVPPLILTIGHSTRTLAEFIALLLAHAVQHLVDVRSIPQSRHNPQFNRSTLPVALSGAGIRYTHMPALGGLRKTHPASVNTAWRNLSFRGYADYMQTAQFVEGLSSVIGIADQERIALMCAEAVPWRCHRSLIADALTVRGIRTEEIVSATHLQLHLLTSFARVEGVRITYPGETEQLRLL